MQQLFVSLSQKSSMRKLVMASLMVAVVLLGNAGRLQASLD
jgi:hypothetical protein